VPAKAAGWRQIRHSPDAVRQALRRALVMRDQTLRLGEDQEGYEVSTVMYAGYGAEIEDDAVRLRRRKLEFDDDAARRSRQGKPRRRRKDLGPVSAIPAALARWR